MATDVARRFTRLYVQELDRLTAAGEDLTADQERDWIQIVQAGNRTAPCSAEVIVEPGHEDVITQEDKAWDTWYATPIDELLFPAQASRVHVPSRALAARRRPRSRRPRSAHRSRAPGRLDDDPDPGNPAGDRR